MDDWLKGEKPFATLEKLTKHHQDIQENVARYLKSRLQGSKKVSTHFMNRLHMVHTVLIY